MAARTPLGKRVRFEVFKRDQFVCQYCGAHPPEVLLHVDHIIPVAEGGSGEMENLVTSCQACNLGKGARPLSVVPQPLEDRAAEIQEREAQIAGYAAVVAERRERIEDDAWQVAEVLSPSSSKRGYPRARFNSLQMFVERLGTGDALDAALLASARMPDETRAFKYFCGICWRWIREGRQE